MPRVLPITLALSVCFVGSSRAQQRSPIPAAWHQPLTQPESQLFSRVIQALRRATDYPHVQKYHPLLKVPPNKHINAWEANMEIFVPVEMFRFVERDPGMLEFLLAHEAGHAKQQELYGQNCYTANNVQFSKFDWFRALGDVVGGAMTDGADGAAKAAAVMQKQACEDNADAWAVRLTRQSGLDPAGGVRLFSKTFELVSQNADWRYFAQQFTSSHSIDPVRIAHITTLIARGQ